MSDLTKDMIQTHIKDHTKQQRDTSNKEHQIQYNYQLLENSTHKISLNTQIQHIKESRAEMALQYDKWDGLKEIAGDLKYEWTS